MSQRQRATIPALDALRAVGALAVVATHAGFNAGIYTSHGILGALVSRLDVGVALFFVLSGFLLSRRWFAAASAGHKAPRTGPYLWHRFVRVYPAYLVCAVLALVLMRSNHALGARDWVTTLLLGGIYTHDPLPYGLTQTWSLATEIAFYLVLPLIMAVMLGRRRPSAARVGAVLAAMAAVNAWWLLDLSGRLGLAGVPVNEWLPAYLSWFGAGILLAYLETSIAGCTDRAQRALRRAAASPGSCWAIAAGLLLIASTPIAGPQLLVATTPAAALAKNMIYLAIGVLVVAPVAFGDGSSRYLRGLSHPVARHLGRISFSVFLVHMPLLSLVMWAAGYDLFRGHFAAILAMTLALTLVAAEVLYLLVERPAARLRRRRSDAATTAIEHPSAATANS